jgi:hypothetical protein
MSQRFDGDVYVGNDLYVVGAYANNAEIQVTANDTTTILTVANKEQQLITGTGVLQCYDLGDARTYSTKRCYQFMNATLEFVGIYNSASSVWHRLPPRATCTCWLLDNSTAAGVWQSSVYDPAVGNPAYGTVAVNDFAGNSTSTGLYGDPAWVFAGGGGGVPTMTTTLTVPVGRLGEIAAYTGASATGYQLMYLGALNNTQYMGGGATSFECSVTQNFLSTAAQEYIFRAGPGNNITGGAHTRASYFLYDRATYGDIFVLKNINAGGNTVQNTAVVPVLVAAGLQKLRMECSSSNSRSDFWIDKVQVSNAGGVSGNVPAITDGIKIGHMGVTKTAGASGAAFTVDYTKVCIYPTVLR